MVDANTEIITDILSTMGVWSDSSEELLSALETDTTPEMIEGYMIDHGTAVAMAKADFEEAFFGC